MSAKVENSETVRRRRRGSGGRRFVVPRPGATIGRNMGGLGGVSLRPRLTKGGGGHQFLGERVGGGSLFLSWEKEFFEDSRVKWSILTTFVATTDQKRVKLTLAIYLGLFLGLEAIFRHLGVYFESFWVIFPLKKALQKVRLG
jgi:hypothetical protein